MPEIEKPAREGLSTGVRANVENIAQMDNQQLAEYVRGNENKSTVWAALATALFFCVDAALLSRENTGMAKVSDLGILLLSGGGFVAAGFLAREAWKAYVDAMAGKSELARRG